MLFQRELRQHLKGFLITTGICAALSMYMIVLLPSMGADMQRILDMKLPKEMQAAFGMNTMDFSRPISTFSMMFSYLYLTFGIYAATLFGNIVAKEFNDKTAEFLFSLPARRIDLIRTKLLVAAGYLTVGILLVTLISAVTFMLVVGKDFGLAELLWMSAGYWLGAMFFGMLSMLLSAFYLKTRLAVGIVLGAYILQVVISLKENLAFMKYLSPFDWFKGGDIVRDSGLNGPAVVIALVLTIGACIWGVRKFLQRDVMV